MIRKRKFNLFNLLMIFIFIFAISFIFLENSFFIHGYITEGSTLSNITISKAISIDFSSKLSTGILFGNINFLPAENVNASENYNATDNATDYYIQVSSDGNTPVDFCINANDNLTTQYEDILGLGNETYSCLNESNSTLPSLVGETALTLNSIKCGENIIPGNNNYYRFWLDVPAAQPSGNYNNSLLFRAISTGENC
jgi:hypothetical protein